MAKPFFYRITAGDFLAEVIQVPESERGQWVLTLALDMVAGKEETAHSSFAKTIISEASEFSQKKRDAANKRWNAKDKHSNALHMHSNALHMHSDASSSSSNNIKPIGQIPLSATAENDPVLFETDDQDKTETKPDFVYPETFLTFWSDYPKKKGKGAALKAWKRIKGVSSLLPIIIESLSVQKKSSDWVKENGKFIPDPARWLNERRWEDEPKERSPDYGYGGLAY